MNRILPAWIALTLTLAPLAAAQEEKEALAKTLLEAGSKMFDARDVDGLVATYADGAEVTIVSRDESTGSLKFDTRNGKAQVEQLYRDVFRDGRATRSINTVENTRWIGPDLLLIVGRFQPDAGQAELPFVQLRRKDGDTWKIVRLQLFLVAEE